MQTVSELLEAQRRKVSGDNSKNFSSIIGIDVKTFGAKGDGVADDTLSFQNAIDYAITVGGVVTIPYGRYRVGEIYIRNRSGVDIVGIRSAHDSDELGSVLIYTGTQRCINIVQDNGDFIYRVRLQNFIIYFEQNCQGGIYVKNLQESTFENVGIWARSKTVETGIDMDSGGIVNIDNCIISRCNIGIKGHYGTLPNPQSTGGSNISRCNIYYCTNAIEIGYTIGLNICENWIEGFQNGILIDNTTGQREVTGLNINNNFFLQSTTGLINARALKVHSGNNTNAIRAQYSFNGNFCFMDSSGSTKPDYTVSHTIITNSVGADVDCVIKSNYFYGATIAAVYSDSPTVNAYVSDNDSRNTLFGAKMETISGVNMLTSSYVLLNTAVEISAPNTTTESTVKNFDIPKGIIGLNGGVRIKAVFSVTNNANAKIIRLKVGSTTLGQFDLSTTGDSFIEFNITNVNSTTAQAIKSLLSSAAKVVVDMKTSAYDTTNIMPLILTVEKGSSTDVVNLSSLAVEVLPR